MPQILVSNHTYLLRYLQACNGIRQTSKYTHTHPQAPTPVHPHTHMLVREHAFAHARTHEHTHMCTHAHTCRDGQQDWQSGLTSPYSVLNFTMLPDDTTVDGIHVFLPLTQTLAPCITERSAQKHEKTAYQVSTVTHKVFHSARQCAGGAQAWFSYNAKLQSM